MAPRKTRFVVLLTGLLAIGFLLTSLASYWVARDSLLQQLAESTLPLTSDNIYSEIQQDLLRPILISAQMAHDTFVRDWTIEGETNPDRMIRFLAEIKERNGTVSSFFVSTRTQNYYHAEGLLRKVNPNNPDDAWYFAALDTPADYEINVDWDTADRTRLTIFINHKVRDFSGQLLGITGVGLSMDRVKAVLKDYRARYGRDVLFVNDTGKITLHADSFDGPERLQDWPALKSVATKILTNPSTSLTLTDSDGFPVYVNTRLVPEFGWHLLVVQRSDPAQERLDNTLMVTLVVCGIITAVVLALAHWTLHGYQHRLEEMASTDKLTGAINRQVFDQIYADAMRGVTRRGTRMAVILLDIDHFKSINDTYGHQVGDRVIAGAADIIRNAIPSSAVLCRWGGEEFLVLAPDHDLDSALHLAEDIRHRIAGTTIPCGDRSLSVTVSLGVSLASPKDTQDTVLKLADDAMYRAKAAGRNRVESGLDVEVEAA